MTNTDSDTGPYTCEGLLVINLVDRVCFQTQACNTSKDVRLQHLEVKDCLSWRIVQTIFQGTEDVLFSLRVLLLFCKD